MHVGIGAPSPGLRFVWIASKVTAHALPCLVGVIAARWAFDTGAGWLGATAVFSVTAVVSFELMRGLFATVAIPTLRNCLACAIVTPAVAFSYFLLEGLSAWLVPSEAWRQALCMLGASTAGLMALGRFTAPSD